MTAKSAEVEPADPVEMLKFRLAANTPAASVNIKKTKLGEAKTAAA